jgi:hypothetical protein
MLLGSGYSAAAAGAAAGPAGRPRRHVTAFESRVTVEQFRAIGLPVPPGRDTESRRVTGPGSATGSAVAADSETEFDSESESLRLSGH